MHLWHNCCKNRKSEKCDLYAYPDECIWQDDCSKIIFKMNIDPKYTKDDFCIE